MAGTQEQKEQPMERLQKVLAHAGVASRRKCEALILQGRVKVNGKTIRELGVKVNPETDVIEVDGREIRSERKVYLLLYKPAGVITSVKDPRGRRVVTDLVKVKERVYPVGRLDYDTEGLLLLTNDGELAHRLAHPRHQIDKVYHAVVRGVPSPEKIRQLAEGIELEDGRTAPGKARLLDVFSNDRRSLLEIVIHEGRNRQVRRMCEAIGHPVIQLRRVAVGFLTLEGLRPGQYRHLTPAEVDRLKKLLF
ncbi:23S rRNA pseudouridine(2605) synthase RluB [Bacillaceae bacterium]